MQIFLPNNGSSVAAIPFCVAHHKLKVTNTNWKSVLAASKDDSPWVTAFSFDRNSISVALTSQFRLCMLSLKFVSVPSQLTSHRVNWTLALNLKNKDFLKTFLNRWTDTDMTLMNARVSPSNPLMPFLFSPLVQMTCVCLPRLANDS